MLTDPVWWFYLTWLLSYLQCERDVTLGAVAPLLKDAIGWDDAEFGWINFAFQLSYAAMFPFAGRLLDRIGVRNGLALGVLVRSLAAAAHSFATTVLGFARRGLELASRAEHLPPSQSAHLRAGSVAHPR